MGSDCFCLHTLAGTFKPEHRQPLPRYFLERMMLFARMNISHLNRLMNDTSQDKKLADLVNGINITFSCPGAELDYRCEPSSCQFRHDCEFVKMDIFDDLPCPPLQWEETKAYWQDRQSMELNNIGRINGRLIYELSGRENHKVASRFQLAFQPANSFDQKLLLKTLHSARKRDPSAFQSFIKTEPTLELLIRNEDVRGNKNPVKKSLFKKTKQLRSAMRNLFHVMKV